METLTRWLRGLLRRQRSSSPDQPPEMKKKKKRPWLHRGSSRLLGGSIINTHTHKKWSFRSKEATIPYSASLTEEQYRKTSENEQQAVAVAAAAAEAAMIAAAEVLRLTRREKLPKMEEDEAALRIQAAFRGYLAKRALLALKGLVRLQAVVRGHIARKQVAEMLGTAALAKARHPQGSPAESSHLLPFKSTLQGPATPEKYENTLARSGSGRVYTPPSPMIFMSSSKPRKKSADDHHKNLLDQLMERRNAQLRPHERSITTDTSEDEKITIKSFHSLFHSKMATSISRTQEQSATSYSSSLQFQSKPIRAHKTSHRSRQPPTGIDCIPSAESSPRISSSSKADAYSVTSNLSVWSASCPSYMAGTASSRAKSRSRSAPRDRPEVGRSMSMRQLPAAGAVHGGRLIRGKISTGFNNIADSNKGSPMSSTQVIKLTSKAKTRSKSLHVV